MNALQISRPAAHPCASSSSPSRSPHHLFAARRDYTSATPERRFDGRHRKFCCALYPIGYNETDCTAYRGVSVSKFAYVALTCAAMSLVVSAPAMAQDAAAMTSGGDVTAEEATPLPPVVVEAPSQPLARKKKPQKSIGSAGSAPAPTAPQQGPATARWPGRRHRHRRYRRLHARPARPHRRFHHHQRGDVHLQQEHARPGAQHRARRLRAAERQQRPATSATSRCAASTASACRSTWTACASTCRPTTASTSTASSPPTSPRSRCRRATCRCSTARAAWAAPSTSSRRKPTKEVELEGRVGAVFDGDLGSMGQWSSYAFAGTRQKGYYAQISGTIVDQDHFDMSERLHASRRTSALRGVCQGYPYEDGGNRDHSDFRGLAHQHQGRHHAERHRRVQHQLHDAGERRGARRCT